MATTGVGDGTRQPPPPSLCRPSSRLEWEVGGDGHLKRSRVSAPPRTEKLMISADTWVQMARGPSSGTYLRTSFVPLKMDCKDSLKNRLRIFAEAIVVMVCPVLLSFALQKVDLTANRTKQIVDSISPIGALTLEAGILPFLGLCLSMVLAERLAWLVLASKLVVHLCVILLMVLAFGILLLISKSNIVYLCILIPFVLLILWLCYRFVKDEEHGQNDDNATKSADHRKLENSVDFSASVTALLFLGLEGLALEGQASAIKGLDAHLATSLILSFATCVLGVVVMLVATVPPMVRSLVDYGTLVILDIILAIALGAIVLLITMARLGAAAWYVFTPWILCFFVWMFKSFDNEVGDDNDVKPVSLELTKAAFTGFLAVSIPSFSNISSTSGYTNAFILLTGSAVLAGLAWRLITHVKEPWRSMAWADGHLKRSRVSAPPRTEKLMISADTWVQMARGPSSGTYLRTSFVPLKMDCKDSLKNRLRIFAEAIVVMVCPVLLSFALQKVDLTANRTKQIVDSISPIGALTLEAGILPFLGLCLSMVLAERLAWLVLASKLVVHLCVILLMVLAFGILLLISKSNIVYLCILIPFVLLILWLCYRFVKDEEHGQNDDNATKSADHRKLENSVDFSASVTALLFLGLEGLALEGQASAIKGLDAHLATSLILSFATCVLGVVVMLVATVPPMVRSLVDYGTLVILDIILAIALGAIVLLITMARLGAAAWYVFTPWILCFFVWMFKSFDNEVGDDNDVKPVSLELTKAAFTGFLAVSIPSFSNISSTSGYTNAFILLTGSAVLAGLAWRLITHVKEPWRSMAWAGHQDQPAARPREEFGSMRLLKPVTLAQQFIKSTTKTWWKDQPMHLKMKISHNDKLMLWTCMLMVNPYGRTYLKKASILRGMMASIYNVR
uniref:Uncharacterized protein n=1 Tax=Oryza punctata TaxID=4537 RepID=A0A0E0JI70_ORYPU